MKYPISGIFYTGNGDEYALIDANRIVAIGTGEMPVRRCQLHYNKKTTLLMDTDIVFYIDRDADTLLCQIKAAKEAK